MQARTPLTLLAGFLGSGKTTLVNRVLSERHGESIAVIVNEFGEVGVDGRLVVGRTEDLVELANGCVCCTIRGDLERTLRELLARRRRRFRAKSFERVLIEASGLASPGPVAQTLELVGDLSAELRLDGIVTLVHAAHLEQQLTEFPEAAEQVGYADLVLVNHIDRVDEAGVERAERAAAAINSTARLQRCERAEVPIPELLNLRSTDPGSWRLAPPAEASPTPHTHRPGVGTVALRSSAPLDLQRLKMWLRFTASRRGQELLRMKGVLRCQGRPEPVVVQAIYQWLELGPGEGEAPQESVLVLIGRDLDGQELQRGFRACRAET